MILSPKNTTKTFFFFLQRKLLCCRSLLFQCLHQVVSVASTGKKMHRKSKLCIWQQRKNWKLKVIAAKIKSGYIYSVTKCIKYHLHQKLQMKKSFLNSNNHRNSSSCTCKINDHKRNNFQNSSQQAVAVKFASPIAKL